MTPATADCRARLYNLDNVALAPGTRIGVYEITAPVGEGGMGANNQPADIWILPLDPPGAPVRFFASPANDTLPVFSPDGKWIAYASDESGVNELYVRPFPKADAKWQVSTSGTLDEHAWSRDGRRLFFRAGDGQSIMAASISTAGGSLAIGRAAGVITLKAADYPEMGFWGGLSLSPDDRGFALVKNAGDGGGARNRAILMLDWMSRH